MTMYASSLDTAFAAPAASGAASVALKRLAALSPLSQSTLALMRSAASAPTRHRRGADLQAQPDGLRFLISGWACLTAKSQGNGRIYAVIAPGDAIDLSLLSPERCAVTALTRVEVVDFAALAPLVASEEPAALPVAAAFKAARVAAEDRLVDHMSRICGGSAYHALADFFTDLHRRLAEIDLVAPDGFHMPIGQARLAEALGLTTSHVNRTLQQLRRDGVLELSGERLRLNIGANPSAIPAALGRQDGPRPQEA
jgi:CRP-like cAMP-binding protein